MLEHGNKICCDEKHMFFLTSKYQSAKYMYFSDESEKHVFPRVSLRYMFLMHVRDDVYLPKHARDIKKQMFVDVVVETCFLVISGFARLCKETCCDENTCFLLIWFRSLVVKACCLVIYGFETKYIVMKKTCF